MNVAKSKVVRLQDRCKQKRKPLTTNKHQTKQPEAFLNKKL
jgi:hypothetical protein